MSNPLLVGVDVHRKTNTVCFMDGRGQEVAPRFTVDNNHPSTDAFIQQVAQQVVAGDFDAIEIAAETTDWYCWIRSPASAPSSPVESSLRSPVSSVATTRRPRCPSSPASSGARLSQPTSRPMRRASPAPSPAGQTASSPNRSPAEDQLDLPH